MKLRFKVKTFVLSAVMGWSSLGVNAAEIDLATFQVPWKNAPEPDLLYDFAEKPNSVHVFEAFSLGCHWCNVNAPKVQELAASFENSPRVQFIDLGLDTREIDYTRWITAHKPSYPVVQDLGRKIFDALKQSSGIPQTFVVDCKGNLVASTIGAWDEEDVKEIKAAIEKAELTTCNS